MYQQSSTTVGYLETYFSDSNEPLFFAFCVNPIGYVVVSARKELNPVIAYSTTSNIITDSISDNPLIELLKIDIESRINNIGLMSGAIIEKHQKLWSGLIIEKQNKTKSFTQWPPEGTTSTGGWIETNWTQSSPYSKYCPIDPLSGVRSYVGCPATAMAQIVNYYRTINETLFTDDDDYYHSYGGRNYWIDNDYEEYDFLSFTEINNYLDSITGKFENNEVLSYDEVAALSFACGVAAHQVYSSGGSGTFGVDQAWDAFQRFGFTDAVLLYENDTNFLSTMAQNMIDARPAQLAMVNQAWNSGHNVVLDGYNTNNYYHINFGWGGAYNGWYLLPQEFPYELTVFEGVVANIAYPPTTTSVNEFSEKLEVDVFPVPASSYIVVKTNSQETVDIKIIDLTGKTIYNASQKRNSNYLRIEFSKLPSGKLCEGLYFIVAESKSQRISQTFIVR